MASAFGHAGVALAIGMAFRPLGPPARFWVLGAICAAIPDLDVVALRYVPYDHMLGHRGLTHSIPFAFVFALVIVAIWFRGAEWKGHRVGLTAFFFLATASHGVFDALTDGGGGVAFLAPFTDARWQFPWRPIAVSPIGIRRFFTARGVRVMVSEATWIWPPAILFASLCVWIRRRR
jgi:inner membrane protein